MGKERRDSKENISNINISSVKMNKDFNLNFDYNKYVFKGCYCQKKDYGKLEIYYQEILNREICQVSNTTLIQYLTTK